MVSYNVKSGPFSSVDRPTLVDDEAVLGEVFSGKDALVSPQEEENFGRVLPDVVHTCLITQI